MTTGIEALICFSKQRDSLSYVTDPFSMASGFPDPSKEILFWNHPFCKQDRIPWTGILSEINEISNCLLIERWSHAKTNYQLQRRAYLN